LFAIILTVPLFFLYSFFFILDFENKEKRINNLITNEGAALIRDGKLYLLF